LEPEEEGFLKNDGFALTGMSGGEEETCRVARFLLVKHTKTGKNILKFPQNIPNVYKLYQMAVK
jgi:hypothetical protein